MSWMDEALKAFGKQMGINNLAFNSRGVCCLVMEKSGKLFLEKGEDELIIYLERPLFHRDEEILEEILNKVHYKNTKGGTIISAGIYSDDKLIFVTKIKRQNYSLPILEETVDRLIKLHDEVIK